MPIYGTHPHLTSSASSLQSNAAYETTELQDNDAYETSTTPSLQSNAAYGDYKRMILEENDDCVHSELTSSLQSNAAYGVIPLQSEYDAV